MKKWVTVTLLFAGCATTNPQHDNFRQVMQRQVGKSADDADFYPALYALKQTNSVRLPNGNIREEYAAGRNGKCKLAFETTPAGRRVVSWSSDGDKDDCVIARER